MSEIIEYTCSDCKKRVQLTAKEEINRKDKNIPLDKCKSCVRKYKGDTKKCINCNTEFFLTYSARQKRNQLKRSLDLCEICLFKELHNGTTNVSQWQEVKEKKEHNNPFKDPRFKLWLKYFWKSKGVDNVSQLASTKEAVIKSFLKKYNVPYYVMTEEYLKKMNNTNLKRHGTLTPQLLSSGHSEKEKILIKRIKEIFINGVLSNTKDIYKLIDDPKLIYKYTTIDHAFDCLILKNNKPEVLIDYDGVYYHAYGQYEYSGLHSKEEYDSRRIHTTPENIKIHIIVEYKEKEGIEELIRILGFNYDQWVDDQFKWCKQNGFPYYNYDEKILKISYHKLSIFKLPEKKRHIQKMTRCGIGDKIIYHFHPSIWDSKLKGCISPKEAWNNDELLLQCIKNRFIYVNQVYPEKVLQGFNINKIAPKISIFSGSTAKILIEKYLNEYNTIFDPFSGYSGRLLGTCSLTKHYIGQDINPLVVKESNDIIQYFKLNATVICKDINKSTGIYDCLFTCPPYGDKEQWWDGRDYIVSKLSCDDWIDICLSNFKCEKYLFVVDKNSTKYNKYMVDVLKSKSHFSHDNYEKIILINK